jgi:hypothetical protein
MSIARGIHHDPVFKLGKAPAVRDRHNLKLNAVLKPTLPTLPAEYDFDVVHPGVPTPMFANDHVGDCVIAGRAHQTLRFEFAEQHVVIPISDQDVVNEYFRESGGVDSGLDALHSLKRWRVEGWVAGARRYFIKAFAEIDRMRKTEIQQAIYSDIGVGLGLRLPRSAHTQILSGQPWEVVKGATSNKDSWGGHYVYVCGYDKAGLTCVTWARRQHMSWAFFDKYCDEAYAIIDATNRAKVSTVLDANKVDAFLADKQAPVAEPVMA